MIGEERARRVGDLDQAAVGHLEHADLLGRPVAVLRRPHEAQPAGPVALDREHHVDEVLERLGPGQRPVLGDVPHEHHRHAVGLGELHEPQRGLPHLSDAPRRPVELVRRHGLDGVDDQEARPLGPRQLDDALHAGLGDDPDPLPGRTRREPEPRRPEPDLRRGLLAGGVEHARGDLGDARGDLEQERGLADPRLAAQQHDGAGHQPAAQHPVELPDADRTPDRGRGVDGMGERDRGVAGGDRDRTPARLVADDGLHEGVPLAARATLAFPAGNRGAAALADEATLDAGHAGYRVPAVRLRPGSSPRWPRWIGRSRPGRDRSRSCRPGCSGRAAGAPRADPRSGSGSSGAAAGRRRPGRSPA